MFTFIFAFLFAIVFNAFAADATETQDILYVNESGAEATYTGATAEELQAVGFSASGELTADFSGNGTATDVLDITFDSPNSEWVVEYTETGGVLVENSGSSIEEAVAALIADNSALWTTNGTDEASTIADAVELTVSDDNVLILSTNGSTQEILSSNLAEEFVTNRFF